LRLQCGRNDGLAEKLVRDRRHVRLAVNGSHAGLNLQTNLRDSWEAKLHGFGVEVIPNARIYGVDADTVYLTHTVSGSPIICENVETVVMAAGHGAVTELEQELASWTGQIYLVGDCLSFRTAEEAVYEGLLVGRQI
jgi:hypothetical protein